MLGAGDFASDLALAVGLALVIFIVATSPAGPASGESLIRLSSFVDPNGVAATTFDSAGHAVGHSSFRVEPLDAGRRRMTVSLGIDAGGRNDSEVTLAPTTPRGALRLVEERSQSTRADGVRLDLLVIDHVAGRVRCVPDEGGEAQARTLELPDRERVVNVPMQLLFQPLVRGEVDEVRFQIVLCTGGPKLQDMIAVRGPRFERAGRTVLEVRYGPDFGKTVAYFASRLLPSLSFWFDAKDGTYLGHRMPLHSKGPEVLLVRSGLTPEDLGLE